MTAAPPFGHGSAEATELAAITAAPAWHQRSPDQIRTHRVAARLAAAAALAAGLDPDDYPPLPGPPADPAAVAGHARDLLALNAAGVLFGPDVSQYQGRPAWGTVLAAGCRIKLWKATEGRTFRDPSADHNQVPTPGMVEGCYHFLFWSQEYSDRPALWGAQADWFARNAPPGVGHVVDVEAAATAGHWLGVKEWVAEYRRLFPGHPLGGYLNRSLWRNRSRMPYDPAGLFDYVWHAGIGDGFYTSAAGSIPAEWAAVGSLTNSVAAVGYPDVRLWQISDHATVPGVSGPVDGNAYQGSAASLAATLTGKDDGMSAAEVQQIKDYLDVKIGALPGAVWSHLVTRAWDGKDAPAEAILSSAHYYAVQAGQDGTVPVGSSSSPGTATVAARARSAAAGVPPALEAIRVLVADDPSLQDFMNALAAQSPGGGGLTKDDLVAALVSALGRVHVTLDNPPTAGPAATGPATDGRGQ